MAGQRCHGFVISWLWNQSTQAVGMDIVAPNREQTKVSASSTANQNFACLTGVGHKTQVDGFRSPSLRQVGTPTVMCYNVLAKSARAVCCVRQACFPAATRSYVMHGGAKWKTSRMSCSGGGTILPLGWSRIVELREWRRAFNRNRKWWDGPLEQSWRCHLKWQTCHSQHRQRTIVTAILF